MGLREDAEAARLAGIERREEAKRRKACEADLRLQQTRRQELAIATDAGANIGIPWDPYGDEDVEHVWVTDPPTSSGYSARTWLHMRSEDGVWLRFNAYKERHYGQEHYRWSITEKCPYCDEWVTSGSWAETLEQIGAQLAKGLEQCRRDHNAKRQH